ncbi:hypothetical protein SI65_05519 [Aspergillus cristatus]|uniref:Zn(2)-C6 fungal-type domain-containing protein n=1 Tax=Aspergillus cristatus TaxID=573508 RepID=A0A1E3BD55_ASPCR|nr:hypothetical protein SI65_05519 [Aspergillus cristatus]
MAGNKRTSSQMDNGNDNPNPNTLDEYQALLYTDNFQDLFEIPNPPSEEDLAMSGAFVFQEAPIDDNNNNDSNNNNNDNGTDIDPGNALALQDPTQVIPVENTVATDINEQATTEHVAKPPKAPRKRRRKGDPEPDHSALVREKTAKSNRCGQACDRCHMRRFKCDEVRGGCLMCLRSGYECKMTNRVTGETVVRGGREGVVINFDDIQRENDRIKEENEKLCEEIEQFRSVIGKLQSQLQHYHSTFSIGAIPGPSHASVSDPSRVLPNPKPQARAMQQANRNFLYRNQTNSNNNGTTQPVASNYNNNAFSGNMSIGSSAPFPIPNSLLNALSRSEWAQPRLPQGFPAVSRNNIMTYLPRSQVQAPMQDNTAQGVPFQGANGRDAQNDQVSPQENANTQPQHNRGQDASVYVQGTSHGMKTLNQGFQAPPQYLTKGAQNQTSQHESKKVQHQDFPNTKVPYKTAHDYPFNFPQSAPQSYSQPVVQFQGAGQQSAGDQIPSFLNDPLSGIKSEDDTDVVKFDLESGFCWTPPLPAAFPSLDLDAATKQGSTANPGNTGTDLFTVNDGNKLCQAQDLSDPEILSLLESLEQQKQFQPPVKN